MKDIRQLEQEIIRVFELGEAELFMPSFLSALNEIPMLWQQEPINPSATIGAGLLLLLWAPRGVTMTPSTLAGDMVLLLSSDRDYRTEMRHFRDLNAEQVALIAEVAALTESAYTEADPQFAYTDGLGEYWSRLATDWKEPHHGLEGPPMG